MYAETQTQNTIYPKMTLRSVFWIKFIRSVEQNKTTYLFKKALEFLVGLSIGFMLYKPMAVLDIATKVLSFQEFVIIKIFLGVSLFFMRKRIVTFYKKVSRWVRNRKVSKSKEALIDGVPVSELVDYLFRNNNFKREGVNGARETFGLNMDRYNRLAQALEDKNVLVRGENNMRVLSKSWSRQSLIDFLSENPKSQQMKSYFRVIKINDPSAKVRLNKDEIMQTV